MNDRKPTTLPLATEADRYAYLDRASNEELIALRETADDELFDAITATLLERDEQREWDERMRDTREADASAAESDRLEILKNEK